MSKRNTESVVVRTRPHEIRVAERQEGDPDDAMRLEGYAVTWDDQYDIPGWWSEKIAKGAFAESLKERAVAVLNGHMREQVVASTRSDTEVKEDNKGLYFNTLLNSTSWSRDVYAAVGNGDIDGVSVGMRIMDEMRASGEGLDGVDLYTIMRAELYEFSMTAFPAYEQSEVDARSNDMLAERRKAAAEKQRADEQPTGLGNDNRERMYKYAEARTRLSA